MKLEIDHLYFVLNENEFEKIRSNSEIYPLLRDVTTKRPDMTYRGLYIAFQNAFYLELLLEDSLNRAGGIGIALSDLASNKIKIREFPSDEAVNISSHDIDGQEFFKCFRFNKGKHTQPYVFGMEYAQEPLGRRIAIHYNYSHLLKKIIIYSDIKPKEIEHEIKKFDSTLSLNNQFVKYSKSDRNEVEVFFESAGHEHVLIFSIKKASQ